ncbi:hypothetical protein [Mycolicibacterium stellerae]|uniref:hypothetical protein n=1 Tax=Mycolicibacterium stellerae TaxID=2358193 RepID=UPI0013DE19E9|nr:hypothetical protein [Mycolicibacterium stellerae]
MCHRIWIRASRLAATAVAVAAACAVVPSPAARAACMYQFPPVFEIIQKDGWHVTFPVSGDPRRHAGPDNAKYWMDFKPDPSYGPPAGGLEGNGHILITVPWSNMSVGRFEGDVRPDGFAEGTSFEVKQHKLYTTWTSAQPLECVNSAPPPSNSGGSPGQDVLDEMIETMPKP